MMLFWQSLISEGDFLTVPESQSSDLTGTGNLVEHNLVGAFDHRAKNSCLDQLCYNPHAGRRPLVT